MAYENTLKNMKLRLHESLLCFLIVTVLTSCASTKNIAYFQNISNGVRDTSETINLTPETPTIEPDDILLITVSGASSAAAAPYNQNAGVSAPTYIGATSTAASVYGRAADTQLGYLVDQDGDINFPILGKLKLKGLTLIKAQDTLQDLLASSLKAPLVNIRFLNYKITVLGEVAHPGTFTIPNQQVTLLQALGMAGDMTVFGKRINVMVIREKDGERQYGRVDLNNSQSLFESPFYYLQQNDVVYVEPRKSKIWNSDQAALRNVSIMATILSAVSILVTRF